MTTKPEVTARSSVLRGVVSRSPPAHNQPQHHVANEREATAASESSTSPVTISAILSWRGGSATGSLNHISRIAGEQFWSSPKEWRLTTYIRRYTSNTMSATIILGAQWGDEGKVRQLSPPLQGQEPLALDRWAGHIHSLTRTALLHRANLRDKQGKIVDVLCNGIQLCCRAQGGHNAGHTIVKDGTTFDVHILRKLPSFAARDQPLTF